MNDKTAPQTLEAIAAAIQSDAHKLADNLQFTASACLLKHAESIRSHLQKTLDQNDVRTEPCKFHRSVLELAGALYHQGFVTETNDVLHLLIQTGFAKHDRLLREEYQDALRNGLDSNGAYECVRDAMVELPNTN